ncbi:hypothetical protein GCM10009750_02330 [Agromyces salentinus]|uniref:Transposase IS701-like DDE domain-containing protein n=1 Tax=Agromyces salentinus TaxID=269421 RepID=A0ABP4YLZ7_9MICO
MHKVLMWRLKWLEKPPAGEMHILIVDDHSSSEVGHRRSKWVKKAPPVPEDGGELCVSYLHADASIANSFPLADRPIPGD